MAKSTQTSPAPVSSWGSVRTSSNDLNAKEDDEKISMKSGVGGKTGLDAGNKWQSVHPFEVLRGREGPQDVPVNHSHFQWGETVTRSPAHQIRHKYVAGRCSSDPICYASCSSTQKVTPFDLFNAYEIQLPHFRVHIEFHLMRYPIAYKCPYFLKPTWSFFLFIGFLF